MNVTNGRKPRVLLLHPGTQHSFHLARQLSKSGLLYKFCTSIAFPDNSWSGKLAKLFPSVKTRIIEGVSADALKRYPLPELVGRYELRKGIDMETVFYKRNEAFQRSIPDRLIQAADIVIGFDTSSWIIEEKCRRFNKLFILDVSIAHSEHWEGIVKGLSTSYPDWSDELKSKKRSIIDTEQREMELADYISVPSNFVKQTYIENGVDESKISVNPFGVDTGLFEFREKNPGAAINFLFFGSLTARKGLPFLLEVWKELNIPARLLLAGYGKIPSSVKLPENCEYLGLIGKDKRQWLFDKADVFVFPSYHEGLALVQIEAAASGLPLIGTVNSGAEEIIEEGKSGFVLAPHDREGLKAAIMFFHTHKNHIKQMGRRSRQIAERFTWESYGSRWEQLILQAFNKANR